MCMELHKIFLIFFLDANDITFWHTSASWWSLIFFSQVFLENAEFLNTLTPPIKPGSHIHWLSQSWPELSDHPSITSYSASYLLDQYFQASTMIAASPRSSDKTGNTTAFFLETWNKLLLIFKMALVFLEQWHFSQYFCYSLWGIDIYSGFLKDTTFIFEYYMQIKNNSGA